MKYLKLFENFNSRDLVKNVEDIFLDLNDEYNNTKVIYNDYLDLLKISIGKDILSPIRGGWGSISEYVDRVMSYLKSEEWILSGMFLDSDEMLYPEKALDSLNNHPEYNLDSVVLIFLEKEKAEHFIKSREEFLNHRNGI